MGPYQDYNSYREAWKRSYQKDPPIPLNIDIELASLCNLSCPFCFISDGSFDEMIRQPSDDGKSRRRLMPPDMATNIIDEAAKIGVPALKFNWRGESTIHQNFSLILKYAKKFSFIDLLVNTNANCRDHAIPGLMSATKVMVSLDSLIPETYKKMRVGGDFFTATQTIDKLLDLGHPNLWVRRVITKENQHEDFIRMAERRWGDKAKYSEHFCFDRNKLQNHEVGCDHDGGRQYCGYPSQRLVIASTGLVYPCCIDLHETMPVGNIKKQSIMEIWNGPKLVELRKELRQNIFKSESCKNCESWMAYKRPERDFVQDKRGKASING